MKTAIIIISAISCLPLFIYPVILGISVMVFDSPGSEKLLWTNLLFYFMLGYPLLIALGIFLAYKLNSVWFALMAAIPLVLFVFVVVKPDPGTKANFDNSSRDFVCDKNKFISVDNAATLYEKKLLSYTFHYIGITNEVDKTVKVRKGMDLSSLADCKNKDGKTLTEVYTVIPVVGRYSKD